MKDKIQEVGQVLLPFLIIIGVVFLHVHKVQETQARLNECLDKCESEKKLRECIENISDPDYIEYD